VYEEGNGHDRKHPRHVVVDKGGNVISSARTQERAVFGAWSSYIFDGLK